MPVTSLLKSAASTRKKVLAQEDAFAAYDWENSAQTKSDFLNYRKYLQNRQTISADPSDKLSYATKMRSAQRSYTSNEIQRQTQAVQEGGGTLQGKQSTVLSLYQQAVANGDYNLAQNLASQYDSLSIQIQNQAQTAGRAGSAAASTALNKAVKESIKTVKENVNTLNTLFKELGPNELQKQISQLAPQLGLSKDATYFDTIAALAGMASDVYKSAINQATTQEEADSLQNKYDTFVAGSSKDSITLPSSTGGNIKVSLQDLKDQVDAARVGETVFQQAGNGFIKNTKTGFVWGRDANGGYRQIPLYNPSSNFTSQVSKGKDAQGKDTGFYSYKELLQNAGFKGNDVIEKDNQLYIRNKGDIPGLYGSPFPTGSYIPLTVGADGQLQTSMSGQAYNLGFDDTGKFNGFTPYQPSAITQVNGNNTFAPGSDARFNANFLGTQNLDNFSPDRASLVGILDQHLAERQLTTVPGFSGNGVNTTRLLNTAGTTLQANAAPLQAPRLTPQRTVSPQRTANVARIQGSAVNPFNLPPVRQLTVKPIVIPRITSVGTAKTGPTKVVSSSGLGQLAPSSNLVFQGGQWIAKY